ncbi:MAG: hypothetical protein AB1347_10455 [Acidobacteriota bacterium]
MPQNLVLRMRDGSMKKCKIYTHFSAAYSRFQVVTVDGRVENVPLNDVKAIFFVRDLEGNPGYKSQTEYSEESPKAGRPVRVSFPDGEVMRGRVLHMAEGRSGFFLFPADPLDNNLKVFVVRSPDVNVEVEA